MALTFDTLPKDIYMLVCCYLDLAAAARLKITSTHTARTLASVLATREHCALHEHKNDTVSIQWRQYPYVRQQDVLLAVTIFSHIPPAIAAVIVSESRSSMRDVYETTRCVIHVYEGLRILELNIRWNIVLIYVRRDGTAKHYATLLDRGYTIHELPLAPLGDFIGHVLQLPSSRPNRLLYNDLAREQAIYKGSVRTYMRGPAAILLENS